MDSYIEVLGLHLTEDRVECLVNFLTDFSENLRRGKSGISARTQRDVRDVFYRLRFCVVPRGDEGGFSCLGVYVPVAFRWKLLDIFDDVSDNFTFTRKYDEKVLSVFFEVIDSFVSYLQLWR